MNNNISRSECSSGLESGWTYYWDQLSDSNNNRVQNYREKGSARVDHEEEYDESMVSDASSGPRPDLNIASYSASKNKKKKKQFHHLEDTATSPAFCFYQESVDSPPPPAPGRRDQNRYKSVDRTTPKERVGFFKGGSKKRG